MPAVPIVCIMSYFFFFHSDVLSELSHNGFAIDDSTANIIIVVNIIIVIICCRYLISANYNIYMYR